jgi:hypothetical protein
VTGFTSYQSGQQWRGIELQQQQYRQNGNALDGQSVTYVAHNIDPVNGMSYNYKAGLNQAYRHLSLTYSITVHPELVQESMKQPHPLETQWIVKKKPPMGHLELDDPNFYVFHTSELDYKAAEEQREDVLFIGRGVMQTAMDMASRMGAKNVILVGVDMAETGGEHHAHDQHVRFHGWSPDDVYAEYRHHTGMMREVLRKKGVNVMSLSPFLGDVHGTEEHERLRKALNLPQLPRPKDTSTYTRPKP